MTIKTVQWNIGGGKTLKQGEDPTLMASYTQDGVADIIAFLKDVQADIITLQEVHKNDTVNQAEQIAKELGLEYVVSDFPADSHVEKGQKLGNAIISRFPISESHFELFINPKFQVTWEDGSVAISHDKGVTRAVVRVDGRPLSIMTTHLTPFKRFGVDLASDEATKVLDDVQAKLQAEGPLIIQGDFNLNSESLEPILGSLFTSGMKEVQQAQATTPEGNKYDHVLFRGLENIESFIESSVLTDHYPVISRFDFKV